MADRITLFITRAGAYAAAQKVANERRVYRFNITPATLKDDDTGHMDRGFKVTLINNAGHPVGFL